MLGSLLMNIGYAFPDVVFSTVYFEKEREVETIERCIDFFGRTGRNKSKCGPCQMFTIVESAKCRFVFPPNVPSIYLQPFFFTS